MTRERDARPLESDGKGVGAGKEQLAMEVQIDEARRQIETPGIVLGQSVQVGPRRSGGTLPRPGVAPEDGLDALSVDHDPSGGCGLDGGGRRSGPRALALGLSRGFRIQESGPSDCPA